MGGGGWCTYDYSVSLSPNLWIMTFNLDLDLDLGLTIKYRVFKANKIGFRKFDDCKNS